MTLYNARILVTGGTGTLGNAIVRASIAERWKSQITIFSRSEYRQAMMRAQYPHLRYILGDVRDYERLQSALTGHDVVIHAAAMKRLPECEEQPSECLETNVIGTDNVINACLIAGISLCVVVSTDKACRASTAYGASKLLCEALARAAPALPTRFVLCRYGNVLASNGSVLPVWAHQAAEGRALTITDSRCTRFWMSERDAVRVIEQAARLPHGLCYVPKMSALNIAEMASMLHPGSDLVETGLRSLEKLHEDLIHPDEIAQDCGDHFTLGTGETGHTYSSDMAPRISAVELRRMIEDC